MSYFDPYFSSNLGKMYSFDPPSSVSSRRAVLSIPIRNLTEYPHRGFDAALAKGWWSPIWDHATSLETVSGQSSCISNTLIQDQ